jgi:predicted acylesterase/phospholipase RssA
VRFTRPRAAGTLLLLSLAGCGPEIHNAPVCRYDPASGYRFDNLKPGDGNTNQLFICLTFSGGGTRAAALSYAVLEELRDTQLEASDGVASRRMLDEVDIISAVSGGSFTAAGYALWRDGLFDGRYERRFLRHNVQVELLYRIFALPNVLRLPSVVLDRIDVAADYFDKRLFQQRTYADLLDDGRRPFIVVNRYYIGCVLVLY